MVPFKGTNQNKVYLDIKNRNIQWPHENEIDKVMSPEAVDLIEQMIQLKPEDRLGYNLDSMKTVKAHPFFKGIDWEEISDKKFSGVVDLL